MGKFIVIDGLDGSGKGTVTTMLIDKLKNVGANVRKISFPMYGTKGAIPVEMYLHGELGKHADDTNGYAASLLFGIDRFISYKTDWKNFLENDDAILIADRYTSANAVHQLTKLDRLQWDEFLDWLYDTEFNKLGLPVPDVTVYLQMRPDISRKLIIKRRSETGRTGDVHEDDPTHLERAYQAALYASEKLSWSVVKSFEGDDPRNLDDVLRDVINKCSLDIIKD